MSARKGHLKFKGINDRTVRCYRKELHRFFEWLSHEMYTTPQTVSLLDYLVGEYINVMYQEGDSISQAGWLLSGLRRFIPSLKHALPTGQQYYNNWVRDHVPARAVPMPWLVARALSGKALTEGHPDLALTLLLGYAFFLRSMEIVVAPQSHQLVLSLRRTKTSKQFHQSLAIHHPVLVQLVQHVLRALPVRGPLWRFSAHQFRRSFALLVNAVGLASHGFSLYSIRRGGATHCYTRTRDLHYVTLQGRWKDIRTARIYLDDARAVLLQHTFPPALTLSLRRAAAAWLFLR